MMRLFTRFARVLLASAVACLFLLASAAQAQVIYVDGGAAGANDGTSWSNAYTTLQDALAAATGNDEIWIAEGTYYPDEGTGVTDDARTASFTVTGNQDGLAIYGGFAGGESAREERDPDAHETVLSGDIDGDGTLAGNSYHVLVFNAGNAFGASVDPNITTDTVLDGVTVTEGNADGVDVNRAGGGLFCDGENNSNVCSPILNDITFSSNTSTWGGAIYNEAGSGGTSSPQITGSVFTGNVADEGGAINNDAFDGESSPQITNSVFMGNVADEGGAIYSDGFDGETSPQITGSVFTDNTASIYGGAIVNYGSYDTSSPQITNVIFTGNTADIGGAIYNDGDGGTISLQITNTILWGNTASIAGNEIYNYDATPTLKHTLIEGGVNGSGVDGGAGDDNDDDGDNLDADPLFADAGNPAGPDGIFGTADDGLQVRTGSPAVDAGTNAPFESGGIAEEVTTDLRGDARIQDGDSDGTATVTMGAYEAPRDVVDLRLTTMPTAVAGDDPESLTFRLANRGNAEPTDVAVDLGASSDLTLTKVGGTGTLSGGTWTIDSVPSDGEVALTVEVERTSGSPGTLAATATVQDGFTVPSGTSDLSAPGSNTAEWASLPIPYGSGRALALDGTDDYVSADSASNSLAETDAFTIEAWVLLDSSTDRPALLAFNGADGSNKNILFYDSGQFQYYDPDISFQSSTETYPEDQWHHVAVVIEADDSGTLYVNGTEQATFATGVRPASGGRFSIGQEWDDDTPSDFFTGHIDEVRLWAEARSQDEIRAAMHRTINSPASATSLVGYWRFDEEGADTVYDLAGPNRGALKNDAARTENGALLGQSSTTVPAGNTESLGASGLQIDVTRTDTNADSTLSLYLYGEVDGDPVTTEIFPEDVSRRSHRVWGVENVGTVAADLTIHYRALQDFNLSNVRLLKRSGPMDPWEDVSGSWTWNESAQTFSKTGVSSFSEFAIGEAATPLPVEMAGFEAKASGEAVDLTWQTASETGNAGFEIQRQIVPAEPSRRDDSTKGKAWKRIGKVDGAGTTDEPQSYRFEDEDLPYEADSLTYRLKQMDLDGSVTLSDPITVDRGAVTEVELLDTYPNPARQRAVVRFAIPEGAAERDVRMRLYDVMGRQVRTVRSTAKAGRHQMQLRTGDLASGVYFLRLRAGGEVHTRRLTVVQ